MKKNDQKHVEFDHEFLDELDYVELDHELLDDELMHFKYIFKEKIGDKWRYWYKKTTDAVNNAGKSISKGLNTAKKTVTNLPKSIKKAVTPNHVEKLSQKLDNAKYTKALNGGIEKKWGKKASNSGIMNDLKIAGGYLAEMGNTAVKYALNNIGKGNADNGLAKVEKQITKTIDAGAKTVQKYASKSVDSIADKAAAGANWISKKINSVKKAYEQSHPSHGASYMFGSDSKTVDGHRMNVTKYEDGYEEYMEYDGHKWKTVTDKKLIEKYKKTKNEYGLRVTAEWSR